MSSRSAGRYSALFVVLICAVTAAGAITYRALREPVAVASSGSAPRLESPDSFRVRNAQWIAVDRSAYAPFAANDDAWRAQAIASHRAALLSEARAGIVWRPSPDQLFNDELMSLLARGRLEQARAELEQWLVAHPGDVERRRELARLLVRLGAHDAAFVHYRRALEARPHDAALRTEYAQALLWNARYDEATTEWRRLATLFPADLTLRRRLAESLAWGGHAAEAEPLLASLASATPGDTALRTLLRTVRGELEPTAAQAAAWAQGDPSHVPYRLAHARALSAEGAHAAAALAWRRVLADTMTPMLLSEAAGAHAAASDSVGTAALLSLAVTALPDDASLRRRWADALAWSGDREGALREYSRLLAAREDADVRLARARLLAWSGDAAGARRDLEVVVRVAPSYDAYVLLADLHRWQGEYDRAIEYYRQALALRPGDAYASAGLDASSSARSLASAPHAEPAAPGWTLSGRYAEDNDGYLFLAGGLSRAFPLGRATTVGASVEQRRIAQRSARSGTRWMEGYALGASATHDRGPIRLSAGGGIVRHAIVRDAPFADVSVTLRGRTTALTVFAGLAPAYERLWAMRTLIDWEDPEWAGGRPMDARTVGVRGEVTLAGATVELSGERARLGDANRRVSGSVGVRAPITPRLRAVYAAGAMAYARAGEGYWHPESYVSHSAGLAFETSVRPGVTVVARVMPGVGRANERLAMVPGAAAPMPWTPQLSVGGGIAVRRGRWIGAVEGNYGAGARGGGRADGYRAISGTLTLRVDW